ncbi:hypothetical protein BT93_A1756 [Corymbia citriodora subsp. variegata]|nr:hypothetical protein BT93_A1756 [Corymbia citriodora subsp. variegata]
MRQDRRLRAPLGVHEAQHRPRRRRRLRARPGWRPQEDGGQGGVVPHQGLRLRREGLRPRGAAAAARGGGGRGDEGEGAQEALVVAAGSRSEMAGSGLVMIGGPARAFRGFHASSQIFWSRRGVL